MDLQRDMVALDDRTGNWRGAYGGPATAVMSVAAVSAVHELAALVDHPALESLREGHVDFSRKHTVDATEKAVKLLGRAVSSRLVRPLSLPPPTDAERKAPGSRTAALLLAK